MSAQTETQEAVALLGRLIADRAAHPARHLAKICFFLGAGADLSSGGMTFWELKRQALEEFGKRNIFNVTRAEDIDDEFEALFKRQQPDDKALMIDWLFHRMQPLKPSDSYKLLVLLAERGGIDSVITTNFDGMLEKAEEELGRDLFQVYAPGVARPYMLSNRRFDPPRKPYLKLHGDIASRSVVFLTEQEIAAPDYDSSTVGLFTDILRTHDVVFAGYGGNDTRLAALIADGVKESANRIFWCGPTRPRADAPLSRLLGGRMRHIEAKFDDLMMEVARPVLERPSLQVTEPGYMRCLFDWRLDYSNREYLQTYGERDGMSLVKAFARRPKVEDQLRSFLQSDRALTVVSGPSGFGKTTLGIRLHTVWDQDAQTRLLLIRSRALPSSGDIEEYVVEQFGGLGARGPFSLFRFERWLAENQLRLILYIDGINEFSPDLVRCVQLFRSILRLCYFLPETNSAIRVITTVRQETWSVMLSHLDLAQLQKTLWTGTVSDQSVGTIACSEFTDDELLEAVARLSERGYAQIDTDKLAPTIFGQLHDPYLLGTVADAAHRGMAAVPSVRVFQQALEQKLSRRASLLDATTIKDVLASVALQTLSRQQGRFREIDVHPAALRGEIIRLMKDLHIFVEAGDGYLQFDHDRTFEFFLALGLGTGKGPSLETSEELLRFLNKFRTQPQAVAAARMHFELMPQKRFDTIERLLGLLDDQSGRHGLADRELLFGFGREVLAQMIEQGEPIARQYLVDVSRAAGAAETGPHLLRAVVQCGANLPIDDAIRILANIADTASSTAAIEAGIYATDKLVKLFLEDGCPSVHLLSEAPYATFFGDQRNAAWQRIGRLLGFASHIGPDNSYADESVRTLEVLNVALDALLAQSAWTPDDATAMAGHILSHCDRLVFNATAEQIEQFFTTDNRTELIAIAEKLGEGHVLDQHDMMVLQPFTETLETEVHYHVCHLLIAISSFNGLEATLARVKDRLRSVSQSSSPIEIDFLHAALVYLHVLHGVPYEPAAFAEFEERILRDWPDVLLYRPGLSRGERRGFRDVFDKVFEDGFGVIYPYGVLAPSTRRRSQPYKDYLREMRAERTSQLPLYATYLQQFLADGRIEEAVQLLHALSGVIVPWPVEGLLTLRDVIGYPDARIRRAVTRVLAEAFNRHPAETLSFLRSSGAAVSDEDLIEIRIRHDAHVGRRQIGEEEWARIGSLLFSRPGAVKIAVDCCLDVLRATSLNEAVKSVLQRLGLLAGR